MMTKTMAYIWLNKNLKKGLKHWNFQNQATLAHTFWKCPTIMPVGLVFDVLSDICQVHFAL